MSAAPDAPFGAHVAALRARLVALADAHARGALDAAAYEAARRDAERALSDAIVGGGAAAPAAGGLAAEAHSFEAHSADGPAETAVPSRTVAAPAAPTAGEPAAGGAASVPGSVAGRDATGPAPATAARPSARLVVALIVAVLVVAAGGYAVTGSPSLAGLGSAPRPPLDAAATERESGLQQIAAMVDQLAARLKDRPDDAEGWTMLARSYTVLSRFADALPAYRKAIALQPGNAGLLADYADAIAAANDGKPTPESLGLLERALTIDPRQPKALALAGTIAFDAGDFATAVRQWQKIADALPPDGEFHRQVVANIDEARRRGGLPAGSPATPSAGADAPAGAGRPDAGAVTSGAEALTGVVRLDSAMADRVSPDDTVFVLARPPEGRMPLAVFRATVRELPLRFRLDDAMAMTPTSKISDRAQVIVAARVSKSGNPITQPGDLAGETGPVAPGTRDLSVVIGTVVPPR